MSDSSEQTYTVRGIVKELYFVEAESADEAKMIVIRGAQVGDVRPAAWETLTVDAAPIDSPEAGKLAGRDEQFGTPTDWEPRSRAQRDRASVGLPDDGSDIRPETMADGAKLVPRTETMAAVEKVTERIPVALRVDQWQRLNTVLKLATEQELDEHDAEALSEVHSDIVKQLHEQWSKDFPEGTQWYAGEVE